MLPVSLKERQASIYRFPLSVFPARRRGPQCHRFHGNTPAVVQFCKPRRRERSSRGLRVLLPLITLLTDSSTREQGFSPHLFRPRKRIVVFRFHCQKKLGTSVGNFFCLNILLPKISPLNQTICQMSFKTLGSGQKCRVGRETCIFVLALVNPWTRRGTDMYLRHRQAAMFHLCACNIVVVIKMLLLRVHGGAN